MTRPRRTLAAALLLGLCLAALSGPAVARDRPERTPEPRGRWLKIRVYERDASTPTLLINLPVQLVSAFVHLAAAAGAGHVKTEALELKDIDLEALWKEIEAMEPGTLIDLQDGGDRLSIGIE